jgi:hypothetical protein
MKGQVNQMMMTDLFHCSNFSYCSVSFIIILVIIDSSRVLNITQVVI